MLVNMSYNVKFRKIEFRCALINAAFILHQFEVTTLSVVCAVTVLMLAFNKPIWSF